MVPGGRPSFSPSVPGGPVGWICRVVGRDRLRVQAGAILLRLIDWTRLRGRGGDAGPFSANTGPARGPLRYGEVPGAVGVLEAVDEPMPVGMALCVGWNPAGLALWTLTLHGDELPGRWLVVDREFRPATGPSQAQLGRRDA